MCIETTLICIETTCIETTLYRNDRKPHSGIKRGLKHYGLGIIYGLVFKTRTEHCGLGIKHEERYKIPISYQVITVHQKNAI